MEEEEEEEEDEGEDEEEEGEGEEEEGEILGTTMMKLLLNNDCQNLKIRLYLRILTPSRSQNYKTCLIIQYFLIVFKVLKICTPK